MALEKVKKTREINTCQSLSKFSSTTNSSEDMKGTLMSSQDLQTRFQLCVLKILQPSHLQGI